MPMRVVTGLMLLALLTACPGKEKAPAPVPAKLVAVAGDGVSAPAGDVIDVSVRVVDANDRPVSGAPVAFQVIEGRGTVAPAGELQSDADGLVRARWQLDTDTVINRLDASGVNGMHVVLTATGVPGPTVRIEKIGDRQFAAAGAVIIPAFRLFDRLGHRSPGAAVTCTVDAGGGSAEPAPSPDPAWDGICNWVLGATPRVENRLTVRAGTATPVTFTAWTGVPSPITVRTSGTRVDSTRITTFPFGIRLVVAVDSLLEVASVTAHLPSSQTPLVPGNAGGSEPGWLGFVPGDPLPRGPVVVRVTAVDVRGNEGDLFLWFDIDHPPVISVGEPLDGSVVRTSVAVAATCADDDPAGCALIAAGLEAFPSPTLTGTSSVSGTFSLVGLFPRPIEVVFIARDSAGTAVTARRLVWLEPSPNLVEVGAAPGEVLDATTTRALFRVAGAAGIADLPTGATITTPIADPIDGGLLVPGGASFVTLPVGGFASLGQVWVPPSDPVPLGRVDGRQSLQVDGSWLLSTRVGSIPPPELVRRDLTSGAEVTVTTDATSFQCDLAATGDVVFVSAADRDLWRSRLAPLTRDGQARGRPRTDGTRVLYVKEVAPGDLRATLFDGADQSLAAASPCVLEPCLALSGAWAAFVGPSQTGSQQVWRNGPGGLEQVTFFGQSPDLEGLTPDGVVILRSGGTRYRSAPGALDPQPVGTANGTVVVRDGKALVLLGRSVLEVVP
jgi:hypothetical protein